VSTEPFRLFCILPGQHGADRRLLAERLAVRPHVWHQEVAVPGHADGYDGAVNDYFLVRTTRFDPRGALSDDELAAEHISGMRWWRHGDIGGYRGSDLLLWNGVLPNSLSDDQATTLREHSSAAVDDLSLLTIVGTKVMKNCKLGLGGSVRSPVAGQA
jgi:hypothetical protein